MRQHQWKQSAPTYHINNKGNPMTTKKDLDVILAYQLKSMLALTELTRGNKLEADESILQEVDHMQKQLEALTETVSKKIQENKDKQDKPSSIFFNCKRSQKAKWVRKAKSMNTNLTQFLIYAADRACEE